MELARIGTEHRETVSLLEYEISDSKQVSREEDTGGFVIRDN